MSKIFVAIASYRDKLLLNTINDCIYNCSDLSRLYFGVVDQNEERLDLSSHPLSDQITYININPIFSRGPCWARSIVHSLYNNEDYVLQIDSHTIFDKGWDIKLIDNLSDCKKKNNKTVLSGYPPAFEIVDDKFVKRPLHKYALVFRPKEDSKLEDNNPVLIFKSHCIETDNSIPIFHIAGGFVFSTGNFFQDVPYDPLLYFHGEEQNLAIRAWTKGWDIYAYPGIPLYHLYHNSEKLIRPLHWDEDLDKNRPVRWYKLQEKARDRMAKLLYYNNLEGSFGLGTERSLEDFAKFSGIDYKNKTITVIPIVI